MNDKHIYRPSPGYEYKPKAITIHPRPDYKPSSLHTRELPDDTMVKSVTAEWCPVCLGRDIGERMKAGRPVWVCVECGNEW